MKKYLLFFAVAAIGLASCSNDETVEVNKSDAISFRTVANGLTRATAKTGWATNDVIDVFAEYKVGDADAVKYFQANFTKQADANFTSETKYYWPSMTSNKMIFTAFFGATQSTSTAGSLASAYTPNASAASQIDLLFARKELTAIEAPVVLNFRHMLSQIDVKVKNTNASLEFDITGVRIGYIATSGTFACTTSTTTANDNLAQNTWTPSSLTGSDTEKANSNKYEVTGLTQNISGVAEATAIGSFSTWMLIPQSFTAANAYAATGTAAASADPQLNGAYIAIKMNIKNTLTDHVIVAEQWCYWPIPSGSWTPGYKYTYLVDLAGGGYQPADQNTNVNLDAVLGTPIEMSASCTIDAWDTPDATAVTMP